ncbi:Calcium-dependent ARF-type GTPase activating protein family isoform 2 [Hibiscus syriacus]|uniref:Calcium-dependent ARF-type GTPase activating protein family isoform 2 n=1 Tax=Hibiscus syriacus TaxID=106335 RepID=A0A6A3A1K1_HIBSY|nr:Calcium-dependent ARF-type GTPase activating protein family isoform 2 [Hibiscus syriacus]
MSTLKLDIVSSVPVFTKAQYDQILYLLNKTPSEDTMPTAAANTTDDSILPQPSPQPIISDGSSSSSISIPLGTYPISNFLSYSHLPAKTQLYLSSISHLVEPKTYTEAIQNPEWIKAMNEEILALESNNTLSLVPLPSNKTLIGSKWVYRIKYNSNGEVERFKAHLVAKGCTQREGVDYVETFSPVAKMVIIRTVMALTSIHQWPLLQMDVYNAFLQGDLVEEESGLSKVPILNPKTLRWAQHNSLVLYRSGSCLYDFLCSETPRWDRASDAETTTYWFLRKERKSSGARARLERMLEEFGNSVCADCGSPDPKWVSLSLGVFVCIKCSGVHRSLGMHISKVLSVKLDEWTDGQVNSLVNLGGNNVVNNKYEAFLPDSLSKPGSESSIEERSDFIRRKYEMQEFLEGNDKPTASIKLLRPCYETFPTTILVIRNIVRNKADIESVKDLETAGEEKIAGMVEFVGLIKVNVVKGTDLAVRDMLTSDPFVILALGQQLVYDKDTFKADDFMGEAEINIQPLVATEIKSSKSKPVDNGFGYECVNDSGDGSSGAGESFRTYKRRRQLSLTSKVKVLDGGKALANQAGDSRFEDRDHVRDFAYNYLEGTIPSICASMNLTFMNFEANQFSGPVPPKLGDLVNLETLMLSFNQLTQNLPVTFNLLRNLTDLRISDINGPSQDFSVLRNMKRLLTLLQKSLYGLKQASRQWNMKLTEALLLAGYSQSKFDYSLFAKFKGSKVVIMLIYVDDLLITGNDNVLIEELKGILNKSFKMKDLGELRPVATPLEQNMRLTSEDKLLKDKTIYQRLIGKLIYLTNTRPDIAYSVQLLSQFMQQPRKLNLDASLRVVKYIKSSLDWATCPMTRRSVTGFCVKLGDSLLSWKSKKQNTSARSSVEAEYRSMEMTAAEIVWLTGLLNELGFKNTRPAKLMCDNKAALQIAANPVFHERTKHIEMDCHFVREKIHEGIIKTEYLKTTDQQADILTKALGVQQHEYLSSKLGLINIFNHQLEGSVSFQLFG